VNDALRRVAYIVARHVAGPESDVTIWDTQTRSYGRIRGIVDRSRIDVYDVERNCHICGPGHNGAFSLYDFGASSRLTLRIRADGRFEGNHDRTNARFTGQIRQGSVDLYDYGSLSYLSFQVRRRPRRTDQTRAVDGQRSRQPFHGAGPQLPKRKLSRSEDLVSSRRAARAHSSARAGAPWPGVERAELQARHPHREA
jgi:hypothetical protein